MRSPSIGRYVYALLMASRGERVKLKIGPTNESGDPYYEEYDPENEISGYVAMNLKISEYSIFGVNPETIARATA